MSNHTSITVSREIPSSAQALFDILSDPHRHPALDGSGFVQGLGKGDRLTKVGQQFTMNMSGPHMGGDYQTDNVVSAFDADKMIGWRTAPAGKEPPGWEWLWELRAEGSGSTVATLTYDWSRVTDQDLLARIGFPLVSEGQLEDSLGKLAAEVSGS
jgi:hypothetical protein